MPSVYEPEESTPEQDGPPEQRDTLQEIIVSFLIRWGPAFLLMVVIFAFSSVPAEQIPRLGAYDFSIKKLGHATGYALLSLAYLRGLGRSKRHAFHLAWLMTILYAASDEYHQSFVPGRGATVMDVGIDAFGAGIGLWLAERFLDNGC